MVNLISPWRRDFSRPVAKPGSAPGDGSGSSYWDGVALGLSGGPHYLDGFLAHLKRTAYLELVERWAVDRADGPSLKTDLFEEAMGEDAFLGDLPRANALAVGMDVSPQIAKRARRRGGHCCVTADARSLPFASGTFGLIVSPSTLDHFADPGDLGRSLRELARVLAIDGTLIVTLDNRQNVFDPLLRLAGRLGRLPYYVGRSYTVGELRAELEAAGLVVEATTTLIHHPRLMGVAAVTLAERLRWQPLQRLVRHALVSTERLGRTRWRYFVGCFVAAKARRVRSIALPTAQPGE